MRSKASYFSISMPLLKENIRRLWTVPVLAFLVYFLSGVFPVLMSYKALNPMARYIEMSLHNLQPFFMGAHLLVPVITAVLLYRYLQNISSVAVMHSMPFTRSKLYNSNFLSGIILVSAPIILNGIILLLLSKPVYYQWGYGDSITFSTVNVFARGEILNWMGTSLLIVIVLFTVAVFAAIVTGNNLMHLLTSYFFIFLIPLLYAVFNVYFQEFLYGFDISGNWADIALSISPYTAILNGGGYFSNLEVLFYLGTIAIMLIISAILYSKRKLERATDSITFSFMKPIICYIIAFLGMTMLGFYFQIMGEGRLYMYAGFAAGTVIFFIIGQMIAVKSPRIYNREGLKSFIAYVLIASLFIVGLNIDVFGFEKRVPKASNVKAAHINTPYSPSRWGMLDNEKEIATQENLAALTAFHQKILDNRPRFEADDNNLYTSSISIHYDTKGLFDMSRRYRVDYSFWAESQELKTIFESAEYKENLSFYNDKIKKFTHAYFYSGVQYGRENEISSQELIEELVANMEKDFKKMSYEDFTSPRPAYVNIELQYTHDEVPRWGNEKGYMNFSVHENAENTINWLKAHGYDFDLTEDMVEWIEIYESKQAVMGGRYDDEPMSTKEYDIRSKHMDKPVIMKITDKDEIAKVLGAYHSFAIDYDKSYDIDIAYRPSIVNEDYGRDEIHYIRGFLNEGLDFLK